MTEDSKSDMVTTSPVMPVEKARDFKVVYANHLRMRVTATDIGVAFGFADDEGPGKGPKVTESFLALMPPQVAKQLSIALSEGIKQFENAFGAISAKPQEIDVTAFAEAINAAQR